MFANERQSIISGMLKKDGAVTTNALVTRFKVSIETIRRDLLFMEQQGLLKRVHGGAVAESRMKSFHTLKKRNEENNTLKKELATYASRFVCDGDIIGLDAGSTAILFAEALLGNFRKLTVITHSLDVFNILQNDFDVILCGGYFKREENSFYGNLTLDALSSLRADKVFIFPSAVSLRGGICDFEQDLFQVQKKLLSVGNEVYVLADSSKFEKTALLKVDDMKSEYTYITDSHLSGGLSKLYEENGIKISSGKNN